MINIFNNINNKLSNTKVLPRYFPIVLKNALGINITDINNKTYIDCISAAGSLPLGHNHKTLKNALNDFHNNNYPIQTMDLPTELQYNFMNELYDFLPYSFSNNIKLQMCSPSGSDVIEAAIKLAKIHTNRNSIICFYGSYHGQTFTSTSMSSKLRYNLPYNSLSDINFLPYPNSYRCPYHIGYNNYKLSLNHLHTILNDTQSGISKPAAIIFEPIQGEGGVISPPIEWIQEIRKITYEHDIPLILDEIQTGFCRTGKRFAFQYSNITPDILCLAKAVGGSMPLGVLLFDEKFNTWNEYQHAGTWRGNQLGFLTGYNTIKYMSDNLVCVNSYNMGNHFYTYMNSILYKYPFIGDIRYKGLMLAIEIVDNSVQPNSIGTYPPDKKKTIQLQKICMDNGLLVLRGGSNSNVIRLMPPLNLTYSELCDILFILEKSLDSLNNTN